MIVPMNTSTTPARPGIITADVFSPGLYRMVTDGFGGGALEESASCRLSFDSAVSVACAVKSWLPSMSTDGNPALPGTTATAAWPSRS